MHVVDVHVTQNTAAMMRVMVSIVVGGGDVDEDVDVASNDIDEVKKAHPSQNGSCCRVRTRSENRLITKTPGSHEGRMDGQRGLNLRPV